MDMDRVLITLRHNSVSSVLSRIDPCAHVSSAELAQVDMHRSSSIADVNGWCSKANARCSEADVNESCSLLIVATRGPM